MIAPKFFRALLFALPAGSLNIPLADLRGRLAELQGLKYQPIVLVCRTDKRSAKAAELLDAAAFGRVEVLRGGMMLWNTRPGWKG